VPDSQARYFDPQSIGDAIARGPVIQGPCPGGTLNSPGVNLGTFPSVVGAGAAFYELALEAYLTQGQDVAAYNAALNDFKVAVSGGHEPGDCHPLYDWVESTQAAGFALLWGTPGFQAAIGPTGQLQLKTFIQAEMLKENFAWNDANTFDVGMGEPQRGNYSAGVPTAIRTWQKAFNPNYFGSDDTLAACVYVFGGGAGCNAQLTGFNYNTFIANLTAWGWTNMLSTFKNTVGGTSVQTLITVGGKDANGGNGKGAMMPFVLGGDASMNPNSILAQYSIGSSAVPEPSFHWPVTAFVCATGVKKFSTCPANPTLTYKTDSGGGGTFGIVNYPTQDPEIGKTGEIYEFQSTNASYPYDTDEIRSDGLYGLQAWLHAVVGASFLQAIGDWKPTSSSVQSDMTVGSEDFAYKLAMGYFGNSSSGPRIVFENYPAPPGNNPDLQGYRAFLAIWEEYTKPGFSGTVPQGPLPQASLRSVLERAFGMHL
jgi:hypothetical protein